MPTSWRDLAPGASENVLRDLVPYELRTMVKSVRYAARIPRLYPALRPGARAGPALLNSDIPALLRLDQ
jgi:hypothetical protein